MKPTELTYEGLKTLRTQVGRIKDLNVLPPDVSRGELKRIYGALTQDLRSHVEQAGGQKALDAFDDANRVHKLVADRRAALTKIVGLKGDVAPEKVLTSLIDFAAGKGKGDLTKLSQARKAVGADSWNDVSAAAVKEMGRVAPDSEDFSGDRFLTAWGKLSPAGKQLLFRSTDKANLAKTLDDIATLSKAHSSLMRLGNPSGTGGAVSLLAATTNPLAALKLAVGGNVLARALASPVTAKSAEKWILAYSKTPGPARLGLLTIATRNLANNLADLGVKIDQNAVMRSAVAPQGQENQPREITVHPSRDQGNP